MAWWLFQNVVMTAVLAAAVAVTCRLSRFGPVARHALWVLVLIKFVTPPLVLWPWPAPDPFGVAALDAPARSVARDQSQLTPLPRTQPSARAAARSQLVEPETTTAASAAVTSITWQWLLALWTLGSACLLAIEGVRLVRLSRRTRLAAPGPTDIQMRADMFASRMGLRPVPVLTVPGLSSPVVWCVGRPRLLWPDHLLEPVEPAEPAEPVAPVEPAIDGLLVHELAHVKRRDHLVGWIELAASLVWWWNPLFWIVRSALREQAELASDAWVISALPNGRRAYAESLLALSSAPAGRASLSMALVGARAGSRRILERRLVMIMKGRAPLRLPLLGLFALAIIAGATLPAWATTDQQQAQQQAQQPQQPAKVQPATPAKTSPSAPASAKPAQTTQKPAPATQPAKPVTVIETRQVTRPEVREKVEIVDWTQKQNVHLSWAMSTADLPEDGKKLLQSFETDREALEQEHDRKIKAREDELMKALQALQDQYTKAGKLDEAVAVRDYIRAGGPNHPVVWIKKR